MLWQVGWTDQIIENSHTSAGLQMFCQQHTMSPCHCPEIMWALRRRNMCISSDFVMWFLWPSVKRPQIRRQKPVTLAHWWDLALRVPVEGTQASTVAKTALDLTLSKRHLRLSPETLHTRAKTICTFHNYSSWYNFRSTCSLVRKQLIDF